MHACLLPPPVLQKLIESSATLSISEFQCCQFRAMCTTAFFAFLRIGEMTYNSAKDASNLIKKYYRFNMFLNWLILSIMSSLLRLILAISNTATTSVPLPFFSSPEFLLSGAIFTRVFSKARKQTRPTFCGPSFSFIKGLWAGLHTL